MTTYKISKGTAWAKPNATRLRFTRKGIEWRGRFQLGTPSANFPENTVPVPHGTTIKLIGLYPLSSALSPSGIWNRMRAAWRAHVRAVEAFRDRMTLPPPYEGYRWQCLRAALRQYASTTHTDSWRVLATWEGQVKGCVNCNNVPIGDICDKCGGESYYERGVALRLYLYDDARGAVFGNSSELAELGHGQEIAWFPEDPDKPGWTVEGGVLMCRSLASNHLFVDGGKRIEAIPLRRPWRFFGVSASHANNGPGRRGAAVDLEWEADLEVL